VRSLARYNYFARSFAEGRDWFRESVTAAGGALETAINPHGLTPEGAPLSTEIAWFGPVNAPRVFLSISGTHGAEYFSGAAGQIAWLREGGPARLAADVAVCLVHAHNCYGSAWHSRGNEDFVDLNRNYMDHAVILRPNPLYAELFDILFTRELDEHILEDIMAEFYAFVDRSDPVAAMTAMGGGQRTHPSGTLFCGFEDAWSTRNLRQLVSAKPGRAERLAIIDWHTGLGDFGRPTAMNDRFVQPEAAAFARRCWGGAEPDGELANSAKPEYVGNVATGIAAELRARGALVAETVIELGTFANKGVLMALLIDRWLRFECPDRHAPDAVRLETRMVERLNPSNPEWRAAVVEAMRGIYAATLGGLADWR
jgi:Protein of unknown function (DUF2817)